MLAFPNAKINLGLRVLSKLPNGYHEISSCLYPIPWKDVLEVVPSDSFHFQQTGLSIPGESNDNLCVKAYELIKQDRDLPPVSIHLHKVVPMGAGLGGGSSDGAFTLKLLNAVFQLELSVDKMKDYASKLGSDCPFFIENMPSMVSGTGTEISPVELSLSGSWLAIKHPAVHISTAEAYAGITPNKPDTHISSIIRSSIDSWKDRLFNDFENSIYPAHPEIEQIKNKLYENGAAYACMSGSGSSVFGIFEEQPNMPDFEVFELP